jgi:hypothetical protein
VTRDPRPYGIENTTDKVRRPGAVRRRRDAVCTERIVRHSYKAQIDRAAGGLVIGPNGVRGSLGGSVTIISLLSAIPAAPAPMFETESANPPAHFAHQSPFNPIPRSPATNPLSHQFCPPQKPQSQIFNFIFRPF